MKRIILIVATLFFAFQGFVLAQPKVAEIPSLSTDSTLVRYWQGDFSVAYAYERGCTNCFMLIDRNSLFVKKIDLPAGTKVNDFRIMRDSVYLGGHIVLGGNKLGLLASFSLHDAMSGAGNFKYAVMTGSAMSDIYVYPRPYDTVVDVKRIALYEFDGRVNIAYIADNYIQRNPNETRVSIRVGLGWAAYDASSGSWHSNLMYNKYRREVYTDIITTDNHVVAVGRETATAKLVLRAYKKPDYTIPSHDPAGYEYLYPKIGQYMSGEKVISDVVAASTVRDSFAVAYHYKSSEVDSGLTVRSFNAMSAVAMVGNVFLSPSPTRFLAQWRMREACYAPLTNSLMVLNDYECQSTGTLESFVFHFAYPLTSVSSVGQYAHCKEMQSITPDPMAIGGFEFSGRSRSVAPFTYGFGRLGAYEPCYGRDDIRGVYVTRNTTDVEMSTNVIGVSLLCGASPFTVLGEKVSVLCGD